MGKDSSSSPTNEFEFGCVKPTSPSSDLKRAVSPADEFFLNGKLLPHSFPIQSRNSARKSSSSSRDSLSLVSSRSSSSSSCSSAAQTSCGNARTSSSDAAERKAVQNKFVSKERFLLNQGSKNGNNYGSTFRRWQIINFGSAPVLDQRVSRRRRSSGEFGWKLSPKKKIKESDEDMGFCRSILRSFVKGCKACHAMEEGAAIEDHDPDNLVELK